MEFPPEELDPKDVADLGPAEVRNLHEIYRDYVKNEAELISQRSTWHLVIQGFLFGTLGVIGEWQPPVPTGDKLQFERYFLVYVLVFIGIAIAIIAKLSLNAAHIAIDALCKKWRKIVGLQPAGWSLLPHIAGGGSALAEGRGKIASLHIPTCIIIAWVLVFILATADRVALHPASPTLATENDQCGALASRDPQTLTEHDLVREIACATDNSQSLEKVLEQRFHLRVSITAVPEPLAPRASGRGRAKK